MTCQALNEFSDYRGTLLRCVKASEGPRVGRTPSHFDLERGAGRLAFPVLAREIIRPDPGACLETDKGA